MNTISMIKQFRYRGKHLNVIKYRGMVWFYVPDITAILGYPKNYIYGLLHSANISSNDQARITYRQAKKFGLGKVKGIWHENDYSTKNFMDKLGLYQLCNHAHAEHFKAWLSHKTFLREMTMSGPERTVKKHISISDSRFFDFGGHKVFMIIIAKKPYFYGNDVANILGYVEPRKAIQNYVGGHDKVSIPYSIFGWSKNDHARPWNSHDRSVKRFITESGIYSLCLHSRLPQAKKFRSWITHTVLPSINHTGVYISPQAESKDDISSKLLRLVAEGKADSPEAFRLLGKQFSRIANVKEQRDKYKAQEEYDHPAAESYRGYINNPSLMNTTLIAKDYGLSAVQLNRILAKYRVIYRQGKHWVLYENLAKYRLGGYQTYTLPYGQQVSSLQWTGRGRLVIFGILNRLGYKPVRPVHQYPKELLRKASHYLQLFDTPQHKLK